MESENIILLADSYKVTHHYQYPPGTTKVKSYFESRGGKFDHVIFFGLQYILKKWLTTPITQEMINDAKEVFEAHFPHNPGVFNSEGWQYILKKHEGYLPILIKAVPEGSRVPVKNVLFTVENTDDNVPWITNYVETLLVQTWYPMTVATNSFEQKKLLKNHMERSCEDLSGLNYKLHDFGYRGCTSVESAGIAGCAHLANFEGSDNLRAIHVAKKFYGVKKMPAISIPAAEHSTITTWTKNREANGVQHILERIPEGPVSIVADSYDLWNFIDNIVGKELKNIIETRNGVFVLRPDSGDPCENLIKTLEKLCKIFEPTINEKGFKILPKFLRVIQGDGISIETIDKILSAMTTNEFSLDNVTFGSGGALLQKLDRDTQKCAFKCCMAIIDGNKVEVFKNPITDPGKQSKKGDITLVKRNHQFITVTKDEVLEGDQEILKEVFRDGKMVHETSLNEIRELIDTSL